MGGLLVNGAHFRGKLSLLNSLDWWVPQSHKAPFLLGLEQVTAQIWQEAQERPLHRTERALGSLQEGSPAWAREQGWGA